MYHKVWGIKTGRRKTLPGDYTRATFSNWVKIYIFCCLMKNKYAIAKRGKTHRETEREMYRESEGEAQSTSLLCVCCCCAVKWTSGAVAQLKRSLNRLTFACHFVSTTWRLQSTVSRCVCLSLSHSLWLSPAANCRLFPPFLFCFFNGHATRALIDMIRTWLAAPRIKWAAATDATRWAAATHKQRPCARAAPASALIV